MKINKYIPIKNIGTVVTGKTPSTNIHNYFGNEYMFVTPTELHNNFIINKSIKMLTQKGLKSIYSNTIRGFSILVGCIGWDMGNVSIVNEECATNQQINAITQIKDDYYNPHYIYYWLLTQKKYLFKIATVTRTPILNKTTFEEILVPIPAKHIQDNIVNLLLPISKKIQLNNAINSELEKLAKTLYDYWFVQFDFPNAKGKPYRASGGKMEYSEILKREIPKGWEVKRFSELATITTGKEDANFSTPKGKYNFFTCGREILRCDMPAFNGKAVLLAGNGDFNVKHYSGEFNAYQRTYVLMPKENAYYAAMYIAAKDKVAELKKGAYGSIVKFITMSDVENIALPVNEGYISLFKKLNDIIIKIELLEQENSSLIELRDFLLPLLMNGQVKVNNTKKIDYKQGRYG